ncbi:MAG: hypothetical protein KME20_03730 [Kaiparowitsia implicata GSE-PSE-MK54-09C]|jgi:CRISPR-associated protein Csx10|nr:hypothetical protein [Kaiparowitsia implicata GSE-PSE-MK54-09C]
MSLNPATNFTLKISMESDWHVGAGAGRGEIDRVVQRDTDDLPYIPAKTLTGILRDGCEQVALALDRGNERGTWHQWVNLLFGDQPALLDPQNRDQDQEQIEQMPRPALLQIRSARLDAVLREALRAKPALKPAIAFMKPGVAIDPETGSAMPDCFRIEELVRMDALLTANHCALDFSEVQLTEDQQKAAYALVVAGAKMVERLGGKRRRGNGLCKIELDSKPTEWLEWLRAHYDKVGVPPQWNPPELDRTSAKEPIQDSTWHAIPLTLTTTSPVVIPARTVGNVVQTLDYIPGRYLLRYLHKTLGEHINLSQAIASGELVITNATIAIEATAGRPTPLCIFSKKSSGGLSKGQGIYNRFEEPEPDGAQIKSERSGYVGPTDGAELPAYETVSLELFTHNTIQDKVQRPTREVGGIYSYQAIPAGTTLQAELRLPGALKEQLDKTSSNWWQALNGQVSIGQSKKDQYGVVQISAQSPVSQPTKTVTQRLYVWCLSDVLLRGDSLAPTLSPKDFRKVLANEMGVELQERSEAELLSVVMRSHRTESWQVRWGLPRPSMLGFQAGSCAVYEIQGDLPTPEKLAELEARGIGDRRAEGYGQLCFNDSLLMTALVGKTRQEPSSPQPDTRLTPIARGHSSFEYARLIERAAWREMIQQKAFAIADDDSARERILGIKIIQDKDNQPKSHPSMSQLGSLRSVVGRLQEQNAQNPITQWLMALESIENRERKWPDGSIAVVRLLATKFGLVWTHLGFDQPTVAKLTITANGEQEIRAALWAEAVRTLIDAVIRAHKRSLEDAQEQADNQTHDGEAA